MAHIDDPILLTGACSGIGEAVATRLAMLGRRVISVDVAEAPSSITTETHLQYDLAAPDSGDQIAAAVRAVVGNDGSLSSVINVAGVAGTHPGALVLEVNLLAVRRVNTALRPFLRRGSTIVNVGSISGNAWATRLDLHQQLLALDDHAARAWWHDRAPSVGTDAYSFSKEAVIVHSMHTAGELIGTGIRCNAVSPGPVETPLLPTFREQIGDDRLDWVMSHAGRAAQPDEIAQAIEWLAVGESHWVNGHHLVVDGGYTSGLLSGWIDATNAPAPRTA
ncbi:MAG: NAD(P)-dependent dehydrogenase (short-subunit alcohol dehydrogenase family) [Candidatus Poriferisodalaceae bacterium]|jgi:NAD(P)-dependent dehydrogenase (short-subunit alcohol dehydrogenase family)